MSGLYSLDKKDFNQTFDPRKVLPYGDTLNDGKVQLSFTLPLPHSDRAVAAAKQLAEKMGLTGVHVTFSKALSQNFSFFIVYGSVQSSVDYTAIQVSEEAEQVFSMEETNEFIRDQIGGEVVVVGASTGTDAHTVGIDAIMNMKGYAGHYGLERYEMIEAYNLGSQVDNQTLIQKAKELNADVLLVSQTVTQKDVHIANLTELVELLEAENMRDRVILICGGPRITNELAKELGYDAGFGPGKFADHVATWFVKELAARMKNRTH